MELKRFLSMRDWFVAAAAATVVLLVYWPAVHGGLVWDDHAYLLGPRFTSFQRWWELLGTPFIDDYKTTTNYFRPLPLFTFLLQIAGHGAEPYGLHLANLLIHSLNSLLVGVLSLLIARRYGDPRGSAWIVIPGVLIFGLHPSNIEIVAWISGRFDLLMTFFLLIALIADSVQSRLWVRCVSVSGAFFAAACCKEAAVVFPLILVAWHIVQFPRPLFPIWKLLSASRARGELQIYLSLLVAGLAYLTWRWAMLGTLYTPYSLPDPNGLLGHILLTTKSLCYYLVSTIYPFSLISPAHPLPRVTVFEDYWAWLSIVGSALLILVMAILLKRQSRLGWSWLAYLLALAPVIHLVHLSTSGNYVHDRYLYFPLVAFSLALTVSISHLVVQHPSIGNRLRLPGITVLTFFLAWSVADIRVTVPLWGNDVSLWTWAVAKAPDSFMAHNNLSSAFYEAERFADALDEGKQALRLDSQTPLASMAVGNALLRLGRLEEALPYQLTAVHLAPEWPVYATYAALTLIDLGRYTEAEQLLLDAHRKVPTNRLINLRLFQLYKAQGKDVLAQRYLDIPVDR